MKLLIKKITCVILILCSYCSYGEAKIQLPSILGNGMVLQQKSEVKLWGKATPNKKVVVYTSWNAQQQEVDSNQKGDWSVAVTTPEAGGPYTIRISDGEELILDDVLIGEVWLCSGQSNMEMPVKGFRGQPVFGSQPYIVSANPKRPLRLYTVKNAWSTIPQEAGVDGEWKEASPEDVADFSATAYFFGNQLQQSLDVPVGLIHCSWSMSKIEAWMNKETLSGFPEIALPDVAQKEFGWTAGTPTLLWNAMVNPWKGFPVKGVIWYQGEANTPDPGLYKRLFSAMVSQWRTFFNNPQMPFYYVQIAPWKSEGNDKQDWAWFRQCQLELMSEVPNVGMVTTGDAGSENFIHRYRHTLTPKQREGSQRIGIRMCRRTLPGIFQLFNYQLHIRHQIRHLHDFGHFCNFFFFIHNTLIFISALNVLPANSYTKQKVYEC